MLPSHARALETDSVLVEGIRGAGKSFWWTALIRCAPKLLASAFPETRLGDNTKVGPGYGLGPLDERLPYEDVIQQLAQAFDPRHIWKAVVAATSNFPSHIQLRTNGAIASLGQQAIQRSSTTSFRPRRPEACGKTLDLIVLFDALDRLAADWVTLRPIAKALFNSSRCAAHVPYV